MFELLDKDNDGVILTKEIKTVLRTLDQDISDDKIKEIVNELEEKGRWTNIYVV